MHCLNLFQGKTLQFFFVIPSVCKWLKAQIQATLFRHIQWIRSLRRKKQKHLRLLSAFEGISLRWTSSTMRLETIWNMMKRWKPVWSRQKALSANTEECLRLIRVCVRWPTIFFTSRRLRSHVRRRLDVIKELSVAMKARWPSSTYIITNSFTSAGGGERKKRKEEPNLPASCAPPGWGRMSLFSPSRKNPLMWSQFGSGAHWVPSCGDNMSCIFECPDAKQLRRAGEDRPTKWEALRATTAENTSSSSSSASINNPQFFWCWWAQSQQQQQQQQEKKLQIPTPSHLWHLGKWHSLSFMKVQKCPGLWPCSHCQSISDFQSIQIKSG